MEHLTQKIDTVRVCFFLRKSVFFYDFQKKTGEASPLPPAHQTKQYFGTVLQLVLIILASEKKIFELQILATEIAIE